MRSLKSVFLSTKARDFMQWTEQHVPFVREWHRFAYEEHFFRVEKWERLFHGVYPDFASAAKAIPSKFNVGYDNSEAATFLGQRSSLRSSDYPIIYWLSRLFTENNILFDFGGYLGISYWSYAPTLAYAPSLKWTIYDVPAVVEQGNTLLQANPCPALSYTTCFDEAGEADVLLASGSLQFCERDLAGYLAELKRLPKHLLVNKTPMIDANPYVTLHSMGPALAPYRIFQEQEFIRSLTSLGYKVIDKWKNDDFACVIPLNPEKTVKAFSGMYLMRN